MTDIVHLDPAVRLHPTRTLVFALRRIAVGGLNDAHAATAMLGQFGLGYRRPLILLRAMMAEMARVATRTVKVAPSCCARLTADEGNLMRAIELADGEPRAAHMLLTETLGTADCLGVLTTAQAVAQSFLDLGKPLALFGDRAAPA